MKSKSEHFVAGAIVGILLGAVVLGDVGAVIGGIVFGLISMWIETEKQEESKQTTLEKRYHYTNSPPPKAKNKDEHICEKCGNRHCKCKK